MSDHWTSRALAPPRFTLVPPVGGPRSFAELAGDDNPVHLDAEFAATTRFKRPIVHGMLYGSLFGTIFGASIPGSVYVSQRFAFKRPVFVGEVVTARVDVTGVADRAAGTLVTCATVIRRGAGAAGAELCMDGEATVLLPRLR